VIIFNLLASLLNYDQGLRQIFILTSLLSCDSLIHLSKLLGQQQISVKKIAAMNSHPFYLSSFSTSEFIKIVFLADV